MFREEVDTAFESGVECLIRALHATLGRDALGNESERALPGDVVSRWTRDRAGRPAVHRVLRGDEQLSGVGYQWRSATQIAAMIDTREGATHFTHDARSYLVTATGPDGSVRHRAADAVGNIYRSADQSDRSYGSGGRLLEADGAQYRHDADGQIIEKTLPNGERWAYRWDALGQLAEVTRSDGRKVMFAYDALGRRARKVFEGKMTSYLWDGNDLVHEFAAGSELVTWEAEPGTFGLLAKVEGEKRFGVIVDHLGTPTALVDDAGEVAWKAQLDLFGVPQLDVGRTECPWHWPGQYEDEETGLYYNRFRYYDPATGRYMCQDPIGLSGGMALYGYVHDPLAWLDPFGLSKSKCGPGGFKQGLTPEEIDTINKSLGGTNVLNSSIESAIAAAERREGFWAKAAAMVRDIAGGHMFNDANKRTAQAVVDELMKRNRIATGVGAEEMKKVVLEVARGKVRDVDVIKRALRGI